MAVSVRHWDKTGGTASSGIVGPANPEFPDLRSGKETDRAGTAQAGSAGTITLDAGASSADDHYNGLYVAITSGTGSGQASQLITDYVGSTRVATVSGTFSPVPDATSVFRVFGATKVFVENDGDRALAAGFTAKIAQEGTSDGHNRIRTGIDTVTVTPPYGVTGTILAASGVWAAPTTAYYRITATNATGETTGSVEVAVVVPLATDRVVLNWTLPASPAGTGIKVYRSTVQGVYTTPALRTTLGWVTTFTDDGSAVGAGALPSTNTTGGASPTYGVPPTLTTADKVLGATAIGQQKVYWINRVPPVGSVESGNPRLARIRYVEA